MNKYFYETDQFGITSESIHYLRSKYPYEIISNNELRSIEIKKGVRYKNRIGLILFGGINFLLASYIVLVTHEAYLSDPIHYLASRMTAIVFLTTIMLGAFGMICFYNAFIKTQIIVIKTTDKRWNVFSLEPLKKKDQLEEFIDFLKMNYPKKFSVSI